jgi:hypothetical protein
MNLLFTVEIDKFRSKLVSSGLDRHTSFNKKHTSLLRSPYITNPLWSQDCLLKLDYGRSDKHPSLLR